MCSGNLALVFITLNFVVAKTSVFEKTIRTKYHPTSNLLNHQNYSLKRNIMVLTQTSSKYLEIHEQLRYVTNWIYLVAVAYI